MKEHLRVAAVAMLFAAAPAAHAASYEIDKGHSSISFKVRHMMVGKVRGGFADFAGTVDYEPNKPDSWKTRVTIQAASIDTGDKKRDQHLRQADFFDIKKYPTLRFISTKAEMLNSGEIKLHGNLTLHGVTKPVVLALTVNGVVKGPWGNEVAGFTATTVIDRMDYGMSFNKTLETGGLVVGRDVEITLEIEAHRELK